MANKNKKIQEKFTYIDTLDFSPLIKRLTEEEYCSAIDPLMDKELADTLLEKYKCFLKLNVLYPKENLFPSFGMDVIWHYHILDTVAYVKDCHYLFGEYLHHAPNFSQEGYNEENATPIQQMEDFFEKHFSLPYKTVYKGSVY